MEQKKILVLLSQQISNSHGNAMDLMSSKLCTSNTNSQEQFMNNICDCFKKGLIQLFIVTQEDFIRSGTEFKCMMLKELTDQQEIGDILSERER